MKMVSHKNLQMQVINKDQDYIDYVKAAYEEWEQMGKIGNPQ